MSKSLQNSRLSLRLRLRSRTKNKRNTRTKSKSKKQKSKKTNSKSNWSKYVTENSNAMDLEPGVFTLNNPHQIALSLKRSVDRSDRLKGPRFKSAMNMLTFYINRQGCNLSKGRFVG